MNIYFSGIGGVGIGPLAEIAYDAGNHVQGSDLHDSLVTHELEERGIDVYVGPQDGIYLQTCHDRRPLEWFVYTSALPDTHPELVLARRLGLRIAKRDELLAYLIKEKDLKLLAVAGTHGKTTTTGMLLWAFSQLNIPVSYSIGTTISFGPSGRYDPKSRYFIYECDEFDRNFLHFSPFVSLITAVDYDHVDTYPTEAEYQDAFRLFIEQSSHVILWRADASYLSVTPRSAASSWILPVSETSTLSLAGTHNRRNATLVMKALEYLQLGSEDTNRELLEHFPGTDRRFERLADNLYSDYGHHPVEIAATLQLARELSDHVVLVYQPHQNIRQHDIKDQYVDQFEKAEDIYWLPTYLSREDPSLPILTPEELITHVTNKASIHPAQFDDALWEHIMAARRQGKLVLCMGAGAIDEWVRAQLARDGGLSEANTLLGNR